MTNKERAEKKKEVELTTLQKITTLEARLTTLSAQPVAIYWRNPFAFCRVSSFPYHCGKVTTIRGTDIHFNIGSQDCGIPLTWLSEGILKQLWKAYKRECEETLPKERYEEVMKGLE